jgi:LPXTG-motif cell wall-anchored protein
MAPGTGLGVDANHEQEVEVVKIGDPAGTGMWNRGTTVRNDDPPHNAPTVFFKNRIRGASHRWAPGENDGIDQVLAADYATIKYNLAGGNKWITTSDAILVSDVQGWLDNPASNLGWLVRTWDDVYPFNYFSPDQDERGRGEPEYTLTPILEITYTYEGGAAAPVVAATETPAESAPAAATATPAVANPRTGEGANIIIGVGLLAAAGCLLVTVRRKAYR